jgi:hypothetical protein
LRIAAAIDSWVISDRRLVGTGLWFPNSVWEPILSAETPFPSSAEAHYYPRISGIPLLHGSTGSDRAQFDDPEKGNGVSKNKIVPKLKFGNEREFLEALCDTSLKIQLSNYLANRRILVNRERFSSTDARSFLFRHISDHISNKLTLAPLFSNSIIRGTPAPIFGHVLVNFSGNVPLRIVCAHSRNIACAT